VILVDTSVWVDHLRKGNPRLAKLLFDAEVLAHPFVIGEISLGRIGKRQEVLSLLRDLPKAEPASHDEVLHFVERHRLDGAGIGWVDAHLLCAAALSRAPLWTADRRLASTAVHLGLAA
jgi:predicted nucleic acid-binding protein